MKTEMCVCRRFPLAKGQGLAWLGDEETEVWDLGSPPGSQASENPRRRGC